MTSHSINDFQAAMGNTGNDALAKLVKVWESKNTRRALRGSAFGLMAVSLAACGGSDSSDDEEPVDPTPVTLSLADLVESDDLPEGYDVEIDDADLGTLSLAELANVSAEVLAAGNADEFIAALDGGDIAVTYDIADTAANILAADAEALDGAASIEVTDVALTLDLADLGALNDLGVTFASAPSVEDTLENADGVTISGVANLTLNIAGETPAGDTQTVSIVASGTGTVTFDFADAEDTLILDADSAFTGFDVLNVAAGTVDVTAADLGGIDVVNIASSITMTAAQFLALDNGIVGGSADATVTIIISTAEEAEAVIAAAADFNGTLDANAVNFDLADGSTLTNGDLTGFEADLDVAIVEATISEALPVALAALDAANDAVTAQEEAIADFLVAAYDNDFVEASTSNTDGVDGITATDVIEADIEQANDAAATAMIAADGSVTLAASGAAFNDLSDAVQDSRIANAIVEFQSEIDTAQSAVDTERTALVDADMADVADLVDVLVAAEAADLAAEQALADANTALGLADGALEDETNVDAVNLALGVVTLDDGTDIFDIAVADIGGVLRLSGEVSVSEDGLSYLVGDAVIEKAVLDDYIAAAQDVLDATDVAADAEAARVDAFDAVAGDANFNGSDDGYDYYLALGDLSDANADLAAFNDAVAAWEETNLLVDQLAQLNADLDDLNLAADDAVGAIEDAAPDGLGVDIVLEGGFNTGNDVYLFDADDADVGVISAAGFAASGTDRIFFGEGYSWVEVAEGDDAVADAVGSVSTLEIFAQETAEGVTLYVEEVASAGTGTTDADMIQIDLAGLTLADLSFDSASGLLTGSGAEIV